MKIRFTHIVIVMLTCTIAGGFFLPYIIEAGAGLFGKSVSVEFWQGAFFGFCPVAIATLVLLISLDD